MSVIKFRTWNGKTLEYDPCVYGSHELGECWINKSIEYEQENGIVFEQFIGLKAKNDREIYEGDILFHEYYYSPEFSCALIKNTEKIEVKIPDIFLFLGSDAVQNSPESVEEFVANMEVIGNIHQNPELKDQ